MANFDTGVVDGHVLEFFVHTRNLGGGVGWGADHQSDIRF